MSKYTDKEVIDAMLIVSETLRENLERSVHLLAAVHEIEAEKGMYTNIDVLGSMGVELSVLQGKQREEAEAKYRPYQDRISEATIQLMHRMQYLVKVG